MPVSAKICGVSTPEAVRVALAGGAAYLGFNFFPKSPRFLQLEAAAQLARPVRGRAKIVAVTVDPSDSDLDRICDALQPDFVQLHGRESPARVRETAARTGAAVIKVLPVAEEADLGMAADYEPIVDHLMFDTKPPNDAERPGGLGEPFDWSLLSERRFRRPWLLAGGLNPWNLAEAVQRSGAPIVDVSSGVERGPGLKDPALITAFLDAARKA